MGQTPVHALDLNFQGRPRTIAAYLIRHADGAALIESGPGSTLPALTDALAAHGLRPGDVTHVFLTHIHLDHAGASGWLARQGAQIFVHANGAGHMQNPEKLLASAKRIYGEFMDRLWGEFLPVPPERLTVLADGAEVAVGSLRIRAVETAGHADHHHAYLFEDTVFTGDVGGVRMPGRTYLRLPMPPPELHLEKWRVSLARLRELKARRIAPTHFGVFDDPDLHLAAASRALEDADRWIRETMSARPTDDQLAERLLAWFASSAAANGIDEETLADYELANPTWMSVAGIRRYWEKHCQTSV